MAKTKTKTKSRKKSQTKTRRTVSRPASKKAATKKAATKKTATKKVATKKPASEATKAVGVQRPPREAAEVAVTPAKGRPMLHWVGKRPLSHVRFFPAQHVETFDPADSTPGRPEDWDAWPPGYPRGGLLFHGDNKEVIGHLLASGFRGKVDLVYIDPPFDSGADYVRRVSLRGPKGVAKIEGEAYSLGEQIQYTDIWANDNYLQFMYERLLLLKELLSPAGSLWLHADVHRTHQLRNVLEEVFGAENLRNEIIWQRFNYRADGRKFGTVHDTLYLVTKSESYVFDKPYVELKASYIKSHFRPDDSGRLYRLDNFTAPGHGKTGKAMRFGDHEIAPPAGTMWRYAQDGIDKLWEEGRIVLSDSGMPQVKRYLDELHGQAVHSLWLDLSSINSQSNERTDFPTQKPESLLERIVSTSSNPGDLVLDCFIGSGTTAAVAQRLGRRWIGADINKGAIQTTSNRLQGIIREQAERKPETNPEIEDDEPPAAAQLGFTVWRVNDYDLAIQHNEAVNLACEKLGVERKRTDSYFDGVLGRSLVKIVPLGHPLTPLDLEELKRELDARPDEERPVQMVALGVEIAARAWVDEWNRLRKGKDAANRIEIIDLRTDGKHGGFLRHEPAQARVRIARKGDEITVEIEDFISPTIVERLGEQSGILQPKIDDWRAMVDCVMVDPAYDGEVFNVALSDVPERKFDLVTGKYTLPAPAGATTVAVKLIDMLGEEVLFTEHLAARK